MKLRWILLATLVGAAFIALYPAQGQPVPDDLVGVWVTTAPKYEGRFFEISKASIIFGSNEYTVNSYVITKLDAVFEEEDILFTVHFHDPDGGPEEKKSFYCNLAADIPTIRFKNQEDIAWTQQGII